MQLPAGQFDALFQRDEPYLGFTQPSIVPITLGILAGLAQACVGGGFLLVFVVSSIRSLFANGSVDFEGASSVLPWAIVLLALGIYEVRVAWRARSPAAPPPPARQK